MCWSRFLVCCFFFPHNREKKIFVPAGHEWGCQQHRLSLAADTQPQGKAVRLRKTEQQSRDMTGSRYLLASLSNQIHVFWKLEILLLVSETGSIIFLLKSCVVFIICYSQHSIQFSPPLTKIATWMWPCVLFNSLRLFILSRLNIPPWLMQSEKVCRPFRGETTLMCFGLSFSLSIKAEFYKFCPFVTLFLCKQRYPFAWEPLMAPYWWSKHANSHLRSIALTLKLYSHNLDSFWIAFIIGLLEKLNA